MNSGQELAHLISHAAHLATGDLRAVVFGTIADYDPLTHSARATLPMLATIDPVTGNVTSTAQTPWLPVVTLNMGVQAAPVVNDQCIVVMTEQGVGPGFIASVTANEVALAADKTLQQGELILKNKKSNTYLKWHNDGSFEIIAQNGSKITFDKNGAFTLVGQQATTFAVDKNGNATIITQDSKEISMPASGPLLINGPAPGGQGTAATIILDASGAILLNPGAAQVITTTGQGLNVTGTLKVNGVAVAVP